MFLHYKPLTVHLSLIYLTCFLQFVFCSEFRINYKDFIPCASIDRSPLESKSSSAVEGRIWSVLLTRMWQVVAHDYSCVLWICSLVSGDSDHSVIDQVLFVMTCKIDYTLSSIINNSVLAPAQACESGATIADRSFQEGAGAWRDTKTELSEKEWMEVLQRWTV